MGSEAFYGCASLTNVIIPNSITSIAASTFYGCLSLTNVSLGTGVAGIGDQAFL